MARTELTVTDLARTGIVTGSGGPGEVAGDVANGNMVLNNGDVFILLRNTDGAVARNFTPVSQADVDGTVPTLPSVSVPAAGGTKVVGPFPPSLYTVKTGADAGKMYFGIDNANLRVQALRMPRLG